MPARGHAMRGTHYGRLALILALCGVATAGCRSLDAPLPNPGEGVVSYSIALPPEQEQVAQALAFYSLGIHFEFSENYEEATAAYRQAAARDPTNDVLVLDIARTLVFQTNSTAALREIEDYLQKNPTSERALNFLVMVYENVGDIKRVMELLQQLTRQFPEKPFAWLRLADLKQKAGDPDAMEQALKSGIRQAKPPFLLQQELVRLYLQRMSTAAEPGQQLAARQQAIELLLQISAELPGDTETLFILGELYQANQQPEQATQIYEKIAALDPSDAPTLAKLAMQFLALNDRARAITILEKLVQQPDESRSIHYHLGDLYQQINDAPSAIKHFQAAVQADPHNPLAWIRLVALQADDDEKLGDATIQDALKALPTNSKLLEGLGLIRLLQHRHHEATMLFTRAYEAAADNKSSDALSHLFFFHTAIAHTHIRRPADAAPWLLRAIEQDPAQMEMFLQRAMTSTPTYRKNSIAVLRALRALPTTEAALVRVSLAFLYIAQDQPAAALREFRAAEKIAEKDPEQIHAFTAQTYFWYGVALDQNKQTDKAFDKFFDCLALVPDAPDALNYVAYLWALRNENLEDALVFIQMALESDPENPAYLDTKGWIFYQLERYPEALEVLLEADRLRPNDPEVTEHLQKTREKLAP